MRQRSLGILGGALLIGGIVLVIASDVAASQLANRNESDGSAGIHRPISGGFPRHAAPGQPGPFFGGPDRRGFPGPGGPLPVPNTPSPSPSG